jgi:hypothetical protein
MHAHIQIYLCICLFIYKCIHLNICLCIYIRILICLLIRILIYIFIRIFICIFVYTTISRVFVRCRPFLSGDKEEYTAAENDEHKDPNVSGCVMFHQDGGVSLAKLVGSRDKPQVFYLIYIYIYTCTGICICISM